MTNKLVDVSRYQADEKCFKKTSYPAVRNFDQFSRNSSFNSFKNIRYFFRNPYPWFRHLKKYFYSNFGPSALQNRMVESAVIFAAYGV